MRFKFSLFRSFRERNQSASRSPNTTGTAGAVAIWTLSLLAEIGSGSGIVPLHVTISVTKALVQLFAVSRLVNPVVGN
jgi:hypothetical protein